MSKTAKLFGPNLRNAISSTARSKSLLLDELGATDRKRLEQLLDLATAPEINFAHCLQTLYGNTADASLTSFRGLKKKFNDAAKFVKNPVRLCTDEDKRSAAAERVVWFTGPDPRVANAERMGAETTAHLKGETVVSPRVIATTAQAMEGGKRPVRFFVSYAHDDKILSEDLVKRLRTQFEACRGYKLDLWVDKRIDPGQGWNAEIQSAINQCEFGLLMLSPAFLASDYITQKELPRFVGEDGGPAIKPVVPVGLKVINFREHDLKGLGARQVYLRDRRQSGDGGFFANCHGNEAKDAFAYHLYLAIKRRLDGHFADVTSRPLAAKDCDRHGQKLDGDPAGIAEKCMDQAPTESPQAAGSIHRRETRHRNFEAAQNKRWKAGRNANYQPNRAYPATFAALEKNRDQEIPPTDEGKDALNELLEWSRSTSPESPPFCAVLGEYGIGKTTTLQVFTQRLLELRAQGEDAPLPIYLDLRDQVTGRDTVPTLEELLTELVRRNSHLSGQAGLSAEEILDLVRNEGALIIFDGLDEKLVYLTTADAQAFVRELWRALPAVDRLKDLPPGQRPGRMILSCRSHYFRDVVTQNAFFAGQDRQGFNRSRDYRVLLLLPFTEGQIKNYLRETLKSPERADEVWQLLEQIYNLMDLARRPVFLPHICEHIAEFEQRRAAGEVVNAASFYDSIVGRWFARDDGKHQIEPAHKRLLMENLAARLTREGIRELSAEDLDGFLDQFLLDHPVITSAYQHKKREQLKEDLRTATFVVRPEAGKGSGHFRFAHTSLQEFFLAGHLLRGLKEGRRGNWELIEDARVFPPPKDSHRMVKNRNVEAPAPPERAGWELAAVKSVRGPGVSDETLHFLGQLLAQRSSPVALRTWCEVLGAGEIPAAILAFRFWILSRANGWSEPEPEHVDLHSAWLEEIGIGKKEGPAMRLMGANLSGTQLSRVRWDNVDLSDADLSRASVRDAEFQDCRLSRVDANGADLSGTRFRGGRAEGFEAPTAEIDGVDWVGTTTAGANFPAGFERRLIQMESLHPVTPFPSAEKSDHCFCLGFTGGHAGTVRSCSWSPDGRHLVSGSSDQTLKIWDAESGHCLRTLGSHTSDVNSCAWSPDGLRLASGCDDRVLKVWKVETGECLLTWEAHANSVDSCAWSPDGRLLASGSFDETLKVWDAQSGKCLRTLVGHTGSVRFCAWSPTGRQLATGSDDGTLRIWDADRGHCLRTLYGHVGRVSCCNWSPDGRWVVSGADDSDLKVWDPDSGQCLRTLVGHGDSVVSCAWSPDGQRLVSGGFDKTLKIWDAESGQCIRTLIGHTRIILTCRWSPDGRRIVSGGTDSTVLIWDSESGQCLRSLSDFSHTPLSCGWSPDGRRLVLGGTDKALKIYDAESGECLRNLDGHVLSVGSCGWSPDGAKLLSGSLDDTVKVWDSQSGKCLKSINCTSDFTVFGVWSPNGRRIVVGDENSKLKILDPQNGKCLLTLKGHYGCVNSCAWSPDGRRLVSGSDDQLIKIWDCETGQCLRTLEGHAGFVACCAWSPDGHRLASGGADQQLKIWDCETGRCLRTLGGHTQCVQSCAWSPDGDRLVAGSSDNTLRVWDSESGLCLRSLNGHTYGVRSCAWSPDGCRLVSSADDKTVRVWDAESGQCLYRCEYLPEGELATIDEISGRPIWVSPNAWRYLCWRGYDEHGNWRVLPAEYFGPLPTGIPQRKRVA